MRPATFLAPAPSSTALRLPPAEADRPARAPARPSTHHRLAVDLHLHSSYAAGVSPAMTLENIAASAQRKGIDLLATGDCLQRWWFSQIREQMRETGTGFLALQPTIAQSVAENLPRHLQQSLRFVLSTEVCCAPTRTRHGQRHHHLLYFRSLESVARFRVRIERFGDLEKGRPTLALSSRELLDLVLEHGDGCALAPAHALNPWNSVLGSLDGKKSLQEVFGDATPQLLAVEMGPTATPSMCRRLSSLDPFALLCSSDAHSPENIGREYTLMEIEPTYDALIGALRSQSGKSIRGYVKFPPERTGYYFNHCRTCDRSFAAQTCPNCGHPLVVGTRDHAQAIADRPDPCFASDQPSCQILYPLAFIIADSMGVDVKNTRVRAVHARLLSALGHERYILTEATEDELANATVADLAFAIVRQRNPSTPRLISGTQLSWEWSRAGC